MKKESRFEVYLCYVSLVRRRMGISQEQLASDLGISRQALLFIEKQRSRPSVELAVRIAHLLEMPVEELFVFTTRKDADRRMDDLLFPNW